MQGGSRRWAYYSVGILILTLGVALSIKARLGTGPFDALLVGLHERIGLTVGAWEIIAGLLLVLLNGAIGREKPDYAALLTALLTGGCIDFWLFAIGDGLDSASLAARLALLAAGFFIAGFGIAVHLQGHVALGPIDRSMMVIHKLTGWNIAISRAIVSTLLLLLALAFSGPIGIGTVLFTLLSGAVISMFIPYVAARPNPHAKA